MEPELDPPTATEPPIAVVEDPAFELLRPVMKSTIPATINITAMVNAFIALTRICSHDLDVQ
jgi:hypothetical protein